MCVCVCVCVYTYIFKIRYSYKIQEVTKELLVYSSSHSNLATIKYVNNIIRIKSKIKNNHGFLLIIFIEHKINIKMKINENKILKLRLNIFCKIGHHIKNKLIKM